MFSRNSIAIAGLAALAYLVASSLLLWPGVSVANNASCTFTGDHSIAGIVQNLDHLQELLPPVPKEDDRAMEEQLKQFLISGLDARDPAGADKAANDLDNNPYYFLKRSRVALKRARDAVGIILIDAKGLRNDKYIGMGFPHRFYENEYADADAVKLDHATYALGPLEAMEIEIAKFLQRDEHQINPILSPTTRGDVTSFSSSYAAILGMYMQCKLSDLMERQHNAPAASGGTSKAQSVTH
jgi:hypothetical protein